MASKSFILLISILTISFLSFPSNALIFQNQNIVSALIGGTLLCIDAPLNVSRTCNTVPNAPVELRCGTGSNERLIRSVLTGLDGTYTFIINVLDTLLFDPNTCYLSVNLAGTSCSIGVPTAVLRIPLRAINVVQALLGNILSLTGGAYTCVN